MRNPFKRATEAEFAPAPKVEDSFIKQVWKAPADFNRAARRAARLWGYIWKWDAAALGAQNVPPRYARRHYDPVKFVKPTTRRQRRHRARLIRIMGVPR